MSSSLTPVANKDELLKAKQAAQGAVLAGLRGQKIGVLIPTIDQRIDISLTGALLQEQFILSRFGIELYFMHQTDSLITRGRNFLIHAALKSPCDWFMWIDSDIRFKAGSIMALLAEDKALIGAGYPIKCLEPARIERAIAGGVDIQHVLKYATRNVISNFNARSMQGTTLDALEADNLGTGFMLSHRSVYEAIAPNLESRKCFVPGVSYTTYEDIEFYIPYFDCDLRQMVLFKDQPPVNDYLSEDYYFCQKAREAGITSYYLPSIELKHVGTHVYEGDYLRSIGLIYDAEKKKTPEQA